MAFEYGQEVFAIPGSPLDQRCTGTNGLVRQGAILIKRAADILNHIHVMSRSLFKLPANDFKESFVPIDESILAMARTKLWIIPLCRVDRVALSRTGGSGGT